jgi:hypothetical protein
MQSWVRAYMATYKKTKEIVQRPARKQQFRSQGLKGSPIGKGKFRSL